MPRTIAIIPDGNRRWARTHRLSVLNGYDKGVKKFISFSEWCMQYGINNIVVWAFSTENFDRKNNEKNTLFSLYSRVANDRSIIKRLHRNRTRFRVVGDTARLPASLKRSLARLENETKCYKERVINMLIGYGGKADIIHAVKKAVRNLNSAAMVSEEAIQRYLLSNAVPEIDFVIRTSGEKRLSGFMPWQTEYSELYFSKRLWPDFTRDDLRNALADYRRRQRRFGR